MKGIECPMFKTPSFRNGDEKEWDKQIKNVDRLERVYNLDRGTKDLFYELLQEGRCKSLNHERIEKVKKVLNQEGFTYKGVSQVD